MSNNIVTNDLLIMFLCLTVKVEISAHKNFSALPNSNIVTCFNFHDLEIFSIELQDKYTYSHVFILALGTW